MKTAGIVVHAARVDDHLGIGGWANMMHVQTDVFGGMKPPSEAGSQDPAREDLGQLTLENDLLAVLALMRLIDELLRQDPFAGSQMLRDGISSGKRAMLVRGGRSRR